MGRLKQLLPYQGKTILVHVLEKLLPIPFERIFVIVGAQAEKVIQSVSPLFLQDSRLARIVNPHYAEGQSAALRLAAQYGHPYDGVMIFLGDQPLIQSTTVHHLFDQACTRLKRGKTSIVLQPVCLGRPGHPVFFSRELLPSFSLLKGDEGAKKIMRMATHLHLSPVDDPGIYIDIDTPEDYQRLLKGGAED